MERSKKMMKRPMNEEVYAAEAFEKGFEKGKKETKEHYRALLRLANEHRLSENKWNEASSNVNYYAGQIELLDEIIEAEGKFDFVAALEKRTAKHLEAEGDMVDVKVKVPDWNKLGEKWLIE